MPTTRRDIRTEMAGVTERYTATMQSRLSMSGNAHGWLDSDANGCSPLTHIPTWMREAIVDGATRQLLVSYRPVVPLNLSARVLDGALRRWRYGPPAPAERARATPRLPSCAGSLTTMDRFNLAYAATAMAGLQSRKIAGSTAIHLSIGGFHDPELPIYVVSRLQRHGVNPVGVKVTLAPRLPTSMPDQPCAR